MLRWADSFDIYGSDKANMLAGAWVAFNGSAQVMSLSTDFARTGTYSLKCAGGGSYTPSLNAKCNAKLVMGIASTVFGIGYGLYLPAFPTDSDAYGVCFETSIGGVLLTLHYSSDGSILGRIGSLSTSPAFATDPILKTSSWQFVEIKVVVNDTVGSVEIRVNGVTKFVGTSLDLGTTAPTSVRFGSVNALNAGPTNTVSYIDDFHCWDNSGSADNDFLGPQRISVVYPDSDTSEADWSLTGAASGFACINQADPDGDTTFISTDTVGAVSEFGIGTIPAGAETIKTVFVPVLAKLSDVGIGSIQISLVSGSDVSASDELALIGDYQYVSASHPVDPATDVAWTKSGLEAALLRVEKV